MSTFRNTNLLITINTNQAVKSVDDAEKQQLVQDFVGCINYISEHMDKFIVCNTGSDTVQGRLPKQHVQKFQVMKGIEIGSLVHRLHAHVLVTVRHDMKDVKIDLKTLRPYLNNQCKLKNVMVQVKPIHNLDNDNLRDYLSKQHLVIPKRQ